MQEPFVNIPEEMIREALKVILGTISYYIYLQTSSLIEGRKITHNHSKSLIL